MKGDFTRGHRPDRKRGEKYRRVLLQQGRLVLDSDVAAGVDAVDTLVRDLAADVGCSKGSPDLGYLVTPGPLFALFEALDHVTLPAVGGAFKAYRDHGAKYQERFPSLYIGAALQAGTVKITGPRALQANAPAAAGYFPKLRVWARIPSGTKLELSVGAQVLSPISGTDAAAFLPYDVDLGAQGVAGYADISFGFSATAAANEAWIGIIEGYQKPGAKPLFWITKGRYYLDGLEVELDSAGADGQYPEVTFPEASGFNNTDLTLQASQHVVAYLEGWERLVTHVEDRGILEQALGGALDTTARTMAIGQVKLAYFEQPAGGIGVEPEDNVLGAFDAVDAGTAELEVKTTPTVDNPDPCAIPEAGGYTGPDNRLYRFEVHGGGNLGVVTIKWSKNNGADLFAAKIDDVATGLVSLASGADVRDGDLIELLGESDDLGDTVPAKISLTAPWFRPAERAVGGLYYARTTGKSGQIQLLDLATMKATTLPSDAVTKPGAKVRRWHGLLRTAPVKGNPVTEFNVGDGITIELSGASFRAGDYWQYEARRLKDNANGPWQKSPHGPERIFAPLALLRWDAVDLPLVLRRWYDHQFSAICELNADDIAYDGDKVGTSADTVQEVIDELAQSMVLQFVGGDGQEAKPGDTLPCSLRVRLTNLLGPVPNKKVQFSASTPGTALGPKGGPLSVVSSFDVQTDADGYAECAWRLSTGAGTSDAQDVTATIPGKPVNVVRFSARRSVATQVGYEPPPKCKTLQGVKTVQEAIDKLCEGGGACEIVVKPEMGIEEIETIISEAVKKGDVKICFAPGDYMLLRTLAPVGKADRNIIFSGAGEGSRIRWAQGAKPAEASLLFEGFNSVTVRDLFVESVIAQSPEPGTGKDNDPHEALRGALTFLKCGEVRVENVHARCSVGKGRSAACITVRGAASGSGDSVTTQVRSVRILRCHLEPGSEQVGALVVDAARVHIEDNIVAGHGSKLSINEYVERLKRDPRFRSALRRGLIFKMSFGEQVEVPELDEAQVEKRIIELARGNPDHANLAQVMPALVTLSLRRLPTEPPLMLFFHSVRSVVDGRMFDLLVKASQAQMPTKLTPQRARRFLRQILDGAIFDALGGSNEWVELQKWLLRAIGEHQPAASQGIVVGGRYPVEARIVNNTVSGVVQGIHVGSSDQTDKTQSARRVVITGNTAQVVLRIDGTGERHGIFVGNSKSTIIEHNAVRIDRSTLPVLLPIEGIRVYGELGPLLMVRENQIEDATIGVRVHALNAVDNEPPFGMLWRVGDNVAMGASMGASLYPSDMVVSDHPNLP